MGAWGYRPFDNDSALDWLDEIEDPILKSIEKALAKSRGRDDYMHKIAACSLLVQLTQKSTLPFNLGYGAGQVGLFDKALAVVTDTLNDEAAIQPWDKPELFRKELLKLKAQLIIRKREETKRCKRIAARIVHRRGTRKRKASNPAMHAGGKA
jgi:hypothetical protein